MKKVSYYTKTYHLCGLRPMMQIPMFNDFLRDFEADFRIMLHNNTVTSEAKGQCDATKFERTVAQLKTKFDSINNKTHGNIEESWNGIYAKVVCKVRLELFPKYSEGIERRKKAQAARQRGLTEQREPQTVSL